jgi:hypothetical protein
MRYLTEKDLLDAIDEPVQEWAQSREGYPMTNGASMRSKLNFRKIAEVTQQMIIDLLQDIIVGQGHTGTQKANAQKTIDLLNTQVISLQEAGQYLSEITSQHQPEFPPEEKVPVPVAAPVAAPPITEENYENEGYEVFDEQAKHIIPSLLLIHSGILKCELEDSGDIPSFLITYKAGTTLYKCRLEVDYTETPNGEELDLIIDNAGSGPGTFNDETLSLTVEGLKEERAQTFIAVFVRDFIKNAQSKSASSFINFKKLSLVDTQRLEAPIPDLKSPKIKAIPGGKGGLEKKNEAPKLS